MRSWDFFDTLFNRKCNISTLYSLIESKSGKKGLKVKRLEVERLLYSKKIDPDLKSIYHELGFGVLETKRLINIEELLEADLLVPNKYILPKVSPEDVILSDTHHSSEFLRSLLINYKPELGKIKIIVSNEAGNRKSDGSMFRAGYTNIFTPHCGDNFHSDVKMCLQSGRFPLYNRDIKRIRKYKSLTNEFYYTVGRSFILGYNNKNALKAFIIAPLLFEWSNSIVEKALEKEVSTLHFLSRDMYYVKHIVDKIIEFRQLTLNTEYLYVSRDSLLCLSDINEESWNKKVLKKCGEYIKFCGKPEIAEKSIQKEYLTSYLDRVLSEGTNMIVDVGWRLTTQNMLNKVTFQNKKIIGFYFGIKDIRNAELEAYSFCFDERNENPLICSRQICDELANPLESLLSAPNKSALLYDIGGPIVITENVTKTDSVIEELMTYLNYCGTYLELGRHCVKSNDALKSFLSFIHSPKYEMLLELDQSLNKEFDELKPLLSKISFRNLAQMKFNTSLWPKGSIIISFPILHNIYRSIFK